MKQYFFGIGCAFAVLLSGWGSGKSAGPLRMEPAPDSDTTQLRYPLRDRFGDNYSDPTDGSPMFMQDPANIKTDVQYDPENNRYNINENMGSLYYRNPSYMTFDEFVDHEFKSSTNKYWRQRAGEDDALNKKTFAPKITVNSVIFDRIFGGNTIDIRPQGSAELSFAINVSNNENPSIPTEQRTVTTFDFKEKIQMNVIANIGDKMKLTTNYNTEATFDFENKMKIEYTGYEDDIIKKIEAGNITMPLNSQLIQGSQSLFGIKTQLQFGKLTVTALFSQQKGKPETINVQGGAQSTTFDLKADQYEENKHFFLTQVFGNLYDQTLRDLSHIGTSVNITKLEVWVTSRSFVSSQNNQNRNIFAFADLGEYIPDPSQNYVLPTSSVLAPSDSSNTLLTQLNNDIPGGIGQLRRISNSTLVDNAAAIQGTNFTRAKNYETVENARLLQPSEYTFSPSLGYISLNSKLRSNDVLAVAFEYTINGAAHRVGELTSSAGVSGDSALFVKLIHSTNFSPRFYIWDLMMKNIYSLGGYNISQDKFRLDVLYQDDKNGGNVNYIPAGCNTVQGIPLLTLFNLDDLNTQLVPQPDGLFDYVSGITINPQAGRIIFPVREPFGSYLRGKFCGDQATANIYAYDALYDSTKTQAQQQPEKNKFSLRGSFQSSSGSEIPLNAVNIPQGSVKVTAGGRILVENADYTVDYTLGRVKIINDGILKSNTPIQINLESNSLFALQTKSLYGTRLEYQFNKDLQVGGTFMHMYEKPLTQKVNIGDEPISNTVWGVDGNYRRDTRFLTKLLDKLPFYSTKEISTITLSGEVAQLIPGHSGAVTKEGVSYIDDFEGAITPLDLKNPASWYLSSVPERQPDPTMFPEADGDSIESGLNRARIAWYYVDPIFQNSNNPPVNVDANERSNNFVRQIEQTEIFPNVERITPQTITCMNLAYYPEERGPYNYDVNPTPVSQGIDTSGFLKSPESRWGGIMRRIETTDFEANNIEFIQFWLMDPFGQNTPNDGTGGELYFNIGSLSEDVLRDQHKSFENGLPAPTNNYSTANTPWGVYPTVQSIVNAFDNDDASRVVQDVGLDGLNDANERTFQTGFLQSIIAGFGPNSGAYQSSNTDPSSDDYLYFLDDSYDAPGVPVLDRYKRWNGQEGNSVTDPGTTLSIYSALPDVEDLNRDNNMNIGENYLQYKIVLKPGNMVVGQNYITDEITSPVNPENQQNYSVKWYQFKIPIRFPNRVIGDPEYTNIEFVRMFLKNFQKPVICRFGKLEFLRGEWRRYQFSLLQPGEYSPTPEVPGGTLFDISTVSIEENGARAPINYVLPPGIDKERDPSAPALTSVNEQSLSLRICDLEDGDARAAYRNTQFDFRSYKKLKMFIHAESAIGQTPLNDGDLHAFIRLGSDFNDNYYEYEIPLIITNPGELNPVFIWPELNNIEIDLQKLISAKLARNNAGVSLQAPYQYMDGANKITIKGTPNLSNVRSIMLGIRNPKDPSGTGAKLCGEVWFNELRLSDFDESGGYASTARIGAKLADLGNMTISGNHSTAGWGSIEKKVSERDREDKSSYDFSTSLELGKFLPEKVGIKIPMYFGYSEQKITPQYNPLDPDVLLSQALDPEVTPDPEQVDNIRKTVTDYTERKSINFTNVRKVKTNPNAKPHIWDVENLNFSYAYTENYQRNYITEYSFGKTHQGVVGYNYNSGSKPIAPFEKTKSRMLGSKWLRLIKDINFNPIPSGLSFRASLDRTYSETQLRNITGFGFKIRPTYDKTYFMRRNYGLNWDLTRSLKLDFNADAYAIIDEPIGRIDSEQKSDSIVKNLKSLGRLDQYHQNTRLTYNVPFSKIPLTDWVSGNVSYTGDYNWKAGALRRDSITEVVFLDTIWGNTIQNSQTMQYGINFTFTTLYNKNAYLKKINSNQVAPKIVAKPKVGNPADSLNAKKDTLDKPSILEPIFRGLAKTLMMIKTGSANYTETNGTMLPGFQPRPDYIGNDYNFKGAGGPPAPGYGFVFGSQRDIREDGVKYKWLTTDTTLNSFFTQTYLQNLSLRLTIEPLKSLKIELTGNRNFSRSRSAYYKLNPATGQYSETSPTETGNFSITYLTWNTHFVTDDQDYSNRNFEQFLANRTEFSKLLDDENPNAPRQPNTNGYGLTQKEVLTASFLAAYKGKSPSKSFLELFPAIPMPNWRVTYDGLSKMAFFKSFLQSMTISHGYRSVYSINSFSQNILYDFDEQNKFPNNTDTIGNFIPQYDIAQITIAEQLSPLIGIDMTWKNSLQTRFEIKRDRTLTLAYSNIQVTEIRGIDYTIGIGYKFKRVTLPFRLGNTKKLSNDLTVKVDVTLRNNTTILRKAIELTNQPSAGSQNLAVKISADYPINDRFNVRAFYDYNANEPFVSSSYPTSNTNAGISIRFTLAQ